MKQYLGLSGIFIMRGEINHDQNNIFVCRFLSWINPPAWIREGMEFSSGKAIEWRNAHLFIWQFSQNSRTTLVDWMFAFHNFCSNIYVEKGMVVDGCDCRSRHFLSPNFYLLERCEIWYYCKCNHNHCCHSFIWKLEL